MAWYRAGTVGVTNGSTTVVLTGGDALANVFPGDTFKGPDGKDYEIASVASSSQFTLATNYQGTTATAQPYAIQPTASTGALRLLMGQVSDLVTNYQAGRDAWMSTASSTLKGRKGAGAGAAEDLTASDVLAILASGSPSALTGAEKVPALSGSAAAGLTANQLLSRAAGQALPFEIGGTRIATITSSGLGVGTPAPSFLLHVNGTIGVGGSAQNGIIRWNRSDGAINMAAIDWVPSGDIFRIGNYNGGPIAFSVNTVERARVDPSGALLVNKTVASSSDVGPELRPDGLIVGVANGAPTLHLNRLGSDGALANFLRSSSVVGSITVTGSSTAYNTSSDHRLKIEVGPLTGAVDRLKTLPVHRFKWANDPDGPYVDGFLAHEAQEVVPESVTGAKDAVEDIGDATGYRERDPETDLPILGTLETLTGILQSEAPPGYTWVKTGERPVYQGIDQSKLVPLLAAALQEAISRIEALEAAA